ncbi:TPA: threonine/serine dehydratase [Enterobacter hormaechei subsp. xiangfangensis]|nr:threonine/serine dehydratase [Enterobacter hormaechei subsp. xiangfangensis]
MTTNLVNKIAQKAKEAHAGIRQIVAVTPAIYSPSLSALSGCEVFLKAEHLQPTGSFKVRGATNKLRQLPDAQKAAGVITASTGNHGQAMALAGAKYGVPVTVYAADDASPVKLEAMRMMGAEVITLAADPLSVELAAADAAREQSRPFVSPYNDPDIIAGQATIGVELAEQLPGLDAVFVAVGGGGLIGGIGAALKTLNPTTSVIGCWPENASAMYQAMKAGEIIPVVESDTLSDGTAGGVEPGSITFPLCQAVIDDCVLVSEDEIRQAMQLVARHEHWIIEGAAGVALAALLKQQEQWKGKRVAVVLCGRNITLEKFIEAVE